jgi:hypothetical protein
VIGAAGPYVTPGFAYVTPGFTYVTPGFIDIHTHFDPTVFWDPLCDPMPQHGATTVLVGNCSLSLAPVRPGDRKGLQELLPPPAVLPDQPRPHHLRSLVRHRGELPWKIRPQWKKRCLIRHRIFRIGRILHVITAATHTIGHSRTMRIGITKPIRPPPASGLPGCQVRGDDRSSGASHAAGRG